MGVELVSQVVGLVAVFVPVVAGFHVVLGLMRDAG